jgi:hypothetical protein
MLFHQPDVCENEGSAYGLKFLPSLFFKHVTGINSPTIRRSIHPSWSISVHRAPETNPKLSNRGATSSVTSVNLHWSFCESFLNMELFAASGYLPGISLPPMNKSRSPSRSKSAALTVDPLLRISGSALNASKKLPLPLFTYSLSLYKGEFWECSDPPLTI